MLAIVTAVRAFIVTRDGKLLAASISRKPFTDIVFVDDSRRNIDDVVRAATTTSKVRFHVFRYEKIWARNADLHDNLARLKAADAQSDAIRASQSAAFDSILCGYSYGFGKPYVPKSSL